MLKYIIVLGKTGWCGHCHHFFPIFKLANKIKTNDIKYISYDLASNKKIIHDINDKDNNNDELNNKYKNETETKFEDDFKELANKISGYPTVFIVMLDDKGKMINNMMIEHVVVDNNAGKTEEEIIKEAAIRFNKNVKNGIDTLKSDGKKLFVESKIPEIELKRKQPNNKKIHRRKIIHRGGIINGKKCGDLCSIDKNEKNYELKYLKYKSKYLELKNKFNN